MAVTYQRVYTFTGQGNTKATRSVPIGSFAISGDTTHTIYKISRITYEHFHTSTGTPRWDLSGRLLLNDGSYIDSDVVSKRFSKNMLKYVNTWEILPSAAQFADLSAVQTIADGTAGPAGGSSGQLYWRATKDQPLRLIVEFSDTPPTNYGPKITKLTTVRTDSSGTPSDEGQYIRVDLRMALRTSAATAGASAKIDYGSASFSGTSQMNAAQVQQAIDSGYTVTLPHAFSPSEDVIVNVTLTAGEERSTAEASIPRAFVTMHLSSANTGGVAFGGFSASTEGHPMAEFYPPVVLYGGFKPNEDITPTLASGISTPGKYGSALRFRRVGQIVYASGTVKCASAVESTDICTIPEGMRPSANLYLLVPVTGYRVGRICIYPDGKVHLDAVNKFGSSSLVTEAFGWIGMDFSYWVS